MARAQDAATSGDIPTTNVEGFNNALKSGLVGQGSSISRMAPSSNPLSAEDGCEDIPGVAHNSADCSTLVTWDPRWVLPDKPLNKMSGAERNMLRSYRLLVGKGPPIRRQ